MLSHIEMLLMIMYMVFAAAGIISYLEGRQWKVRFKYFGTFCAAAIPFFGMVFYFITN